MEEQRNQTPVAEPVPAPARPAFSGAPRAERVDKNGRPRRMTRYLGPRAPRTCPFCAQKAKKVDYKDVDQLRRYLTDHGKIKPRRKIGACARHQRMLATAIKRARHVALLPHTAEAARPE